jgi:AAA domain
MKSPEDDPDIVIELPSLDRLRAATAKIREPTAERRARPNGEGEPLAKLTPISFVEGEVLSPRDWIVYDGWIPTRKVTLIQGDGGEGKTPLVHQLQSSCATALPWLGLRVKECPSVGFYTEDEEQERQVAIDAAYGCACAKTGNMHLFPRVGEENELVVFDRARRPAVTKFYRQVCEAAFDFRARLVVLDVAVDFFAGNEIARQEVRAFFHRLIGLARKIDGAVVLTSHVSQAGIRSDGGHSGSTDWSNAARTRLYLNRPKAENGTDADTNARTLTRKKANFARTGDTMKLHWENGLIVPDGVPAPSYCRRSADDVFLALLDAVIAEGQNVSDKSRAGNYAPTLFLKRPAKDRGDYKKPDFDRAMQSLLKSRKIKIVPYGPPSSGHQKLVRAETEDGPS